MTDANDPMAALRAKYGLGGTSPSAPQPAPTPTAPPPAPAPAGPTPAPDAADPMAALRAKYGIAPATAPAPASTPGQALGTILTDRTAAADIAIKAQQAGLQADLTSLASGDTKKVQDWERLSKVIIRLVEGGTPEDQKYAQSVLQQYGDVLKPHIAANVGPTWFDENYQPPKGPNRFQKVMGALNPLWDWLDKGLQGTYAAVNDIYSINPNDLGAIKNFQAGNFKAGVSDVAGAVGNVAQGIGSLATFGAVPGVDNSDIDRNGDGRADIFEALNKTDPGPSIKGVSVIGLLADLAFDPLSYVSLKPSHRVRAAVDQSATQAAKVGEEAMHSSIWSKIRDPKAGFDTLSDLEKVKLELWIEKANIDSLAARAAKDPTIRQKVADNIRKAAGKVETLEQKAARLADDTMLDIKRGGQSGVHVAGTTVLKNPLERVPGLTSKLKYGEVVDEAATAARLKSTLDAMPGPAMAPKVVEDLSAPIFRTKALLEEVGQEMFQQPSLFSVGEAASDAAKASVPWSGKMASSAEKAAEAVPGIRKSMDDIAQEFGKITESTQGAMFKVADEAAALSDNPWTGEMRAVAAKHPALQRSLDSLEEAFGYIDEAEQGTLFFENAAAQLQQALADLGVELKNVGANLVPNSAASAGTPWTGKLAELAKADPAVNRSLQEIQEAFGYITKAEQDSLLRRVEAVADDALSETPWDGTMSAVQHAEAVAPAVRRSLDEIVQELGPIKAANQGSMIEQTLKPAADSLAASPWTGKLTKAIEDSPALRQSFQDINERLGKLSSAEQRTMLDALEQVEPVMYHGVTSIEPGLLRKAGDLKYIKGLREAIIPRAGMVNRIGKANADAVRRVQVEVKGAADDLLAMLNARVVDSPLAARAQKEFGSLEEYQKWLQNSLKNPTAMIEGLSEGGARADLLNMVANIRDEVVGALSDDAQKLINTDFYNPAVLSESGKESLAALFDVDPARFQKLASEFGADVGGVKRADEAIGRIQKALNKPGTSSFNRFATTSFEMNAKGREVLQNAGVAKVEDLFENDALKQWAARGRQAYTSKVIGEYADTLAKMTDETGLPYVVKDMDEAVKKGGNRFAGYVSVPQLGGYVHKDLASDFTNVFDKIHNEGFLADFGKTVEKYNSMWARYATLSPGFHYRNAIGNVFNASLAGLTNPGRYKEAWDALATNRKIINEMGETGLSFDKAAAKLGVDSFTTQAIKDMRRYQVITGQIDDIFDATEELSDWNPTKWSRRGGTAIEHNARAALYLDQIAKGVNPETAAETVKKFLFDYDDLTKFEKGLKGTVSRFYTFTRKNLPLQLEVLATNPGRIANANKISQAYTDAMTNWFTGSSEGSDGPMPAWAAAAGMQWRGGNIVGVDTPIGQAAKTAEALGAAASIPLYVLFSDEKSREWIPSIIRDGLMYGDDQDRFTRAMGLFNGLGPSVADYAYAHATGVDPFTHGTLKGDPIVDFLSAFNPGVDRLFRLGEDVGLTSLNEEGDRMKRKGQEGFQEDAAVGDWGLLALNWLMGFNAKPGKEVDRSNYYTLSSSLNDIVKQYSDFTNKYGEQGLPSMQDLVANQEVDLVNRATYALLYEAPGPELDAFMERTVGKDLLKAYGLARETNPAMAKDEEFEKKKALNSIDERATALRYILGRELTEQDYWTIAWNSPWAPTNTEAKEAGLEPYRSSNAFDPDAKKKEAARVEQTIADFTDLVKAAAGDTFEGLDMSAILKPRLAAFDRLLEDAAAQGLTPQDAINYASQNMSRAMKATFNRMGMGDVVGPLETWVYDPRNARDDYNDQNDSADDEALFRGVFYVKYGRMPTIDEAKYFQVGANMTRSQAQTLADLGQIPQGFVPDTVPARENLKTDQQKAAETVQEWIARQQGMTNGFATGPKPEDVPARTG